MSTLGDKIRQLRKAKDMTQEELADALNVNRATLANWELNRATPDPATLGTLANYFQVSVDWLLGRTEDPHGVSLPPNAWPAKAFRPVPILGVIRAGEPIYAEQNIEGYEMLPEEDLKNGEYFFLRVVGDSMKDARIEDGDLVFVRRQDWVENGDIAVVMVNGEDATVKQVFFDGDALALVPANPLYKTIILRGRQKEETRIIGKVLWFKGMPRKYAR